MDTPQFTIEVAQEFHRRMAAIIATVQQGVWQAGAHDLLGHATDYAFGGARGAQTLILKTRNRSTYLRLSWDAITGNSVEDRLLVDQAIASAINELC